MLACVARETAARSPEVYRFFKDAGVEFIQFTPVVERMPDRQSVTEGLRPAAPAALDSREGQGEVTPWSLVPESWGDFLIGVLEEWVRNDVGRVFIMNFEWALQSNMAEKKA